MLIAPVLAQEDFSGPAGGSYYVLSKERDEQGRPLGFLTRKEARELRARDEQEMYERARDEASMLDSFKTAVVTDGDETSTDEVERA